MFDEHRQFQSCIFCGSTAKLTKGHIFGKALARRFPLAHHWRAGRSIIGPPDKKGSSRITSVAPPVACDTCNNQDLSGDMEASLEPLMQLIEGKPHKIASQGRAVVSRCCERIGLIADVMTSNYQITEEYKASAEYELSKEHRQAPPLYSDQDRQAWRAGGKLPNMRVYIGFHSAVLGLDPYMNMAHERSVLEDRITGSSPLPSQGPSMGWPEEGCARVRRLRELPADGALLQALLHALDAFLGVPNASVSVSGLFG